ncbi:DUF3667 domain-containing protein [Spirosoma sp. SC4-14]|uniref:DUF3667 domain-containing protein n=1 Tax=Spirosoma sp. SC4-14 TaxID=3128900 RepID=UPI0030D5017A
MSTEHDQWSVCPNCDTPLPEHAHYCPNCGQENHTHKQPFGHLLYEFVESITHFDAKLWATLKATVLKPGQFVVDFVNDKRARYVPPARLYVFVSVIFFVMVNKVTESALHHSLEIEEKVHDIYGNKASEFTLDGVLGKAVVEEKGLDEIGNAKFYFNQKSDPKAQSTIAYLKTLSSTQLDSLVHEFWEEGQNEKVNIDNDAEEQQTVEKSKNPLSFAQQLQKGVSYLPASLPVRYTEDDDETTTSESYSVPVSRLIERDTLNASNLSLVKTITIPFANGDSLGIATLAALKQYNRQQLLDLYGQTHAILPDMRNQIYSEMKTLVTLLPNEYDHSRNRKVGNQADYLGLKLIFPNDSTRDAQIRLTKYMNDEQLTHFIAQHSNQSLDEMSWWKRSFILKSIRQSAKFKTTEPLTDRPEVLHNLLHVIIKYVSWVMFLLMPVVAFVLLIIYFRKRKFYYEHLIFSVHVHTVFFMILTIGLTISYYAHWDDAVGWCFLLGYLYLLLAMKRTYGQGWAKTIAKFALFTLIYGFVFAMLFGISGVLGFLNF